MKQTVSTLKLLTRGYSTASGDRKDLKDRPEQPVHAIFVARNGNGRGVAPEDHDGGAEWLAGVPHLDGGQAASLLCAEQVLRRCLGLEHHVRPGRRAHKQPNMLTVLAAWHLLRQSLINLLYSCTFGVNKLLTFPHVDWGVSSLLDQHASQASPGTRGEALPALATDCEYVDGVGPFSAGLALVCGSSHERVHVRLTEEGKCAGVLKLCQVDALSDGLYARFPHFVTAMRVFEKRDNLTRHRE